MGQAPISLLLWSFFFWGGEAGGGGGGGVGGGMRGATWLPKLASTTVAEAASR